MDSETLTYVILAVTGAVILGAYGYLILIPAWTAYGRNWERVAAAVLTLFVLAAFAGSGLGAGLVIVYYWDEIIGVFGADSATLVPLLGLAAQASGS
jgi:ABC-type transporter Mla maintaining outer membrane lipid asymmetry permease subunit MlaE